MKLNVKILIYVLIIAWLGFLVFQGPTLMAKGHDEGGCAASTMQGLSCPMILTAFDFINFHAKALAELSTATFSSLGFSQILFAIFAIFSVAIFIKMRILKSLFERALQKSFLYSWLQKHFETFFPISKLNLFNWLASQERSPSFI